MTAPERTTGEQGMMADMLIQAFQHFNDSTAQLQQSYRRLEKRIQELKGELEWKNRQLKEHLTLKEAVETSLRNILESLTLGVMVTDLAGRITTFNRGAEQLTECSAETAIGMSIDELLCLAFGQVSAPRLPMNGPCKLEQVVIRDEQALHLSFALSSLQGNQGECLGSVIIMEDVTRMRHLEEQVHRTNRLAAMGEMAASIAHEVRNPLGGIELFASQLKQELEREPGKQTLVEHILSGVKSLNRTISNMLLFTKSPAPRFEPVDPHQLLEASLVFASHLVRYQHLRLQKNFGAAGATVHADPELLKQVFLNLILNAIQAMPEGGTLTLVTRLNQHALEAKVSDTGIGMSPEVTQKIFNPFFSTKEGGTGLGLTIVHNIVEAHNGSIHVVSARGKGTTFSIFLPLEPAMAGLSHWETYAPAQGMALRSGD